MIEIVSLVCFDNQKRVPYLSRSFGSFYRHYSGQKFRHLVFDSSRLLGLQQEHYERYGVEVHHTPGASYGERLRLAGQTVQSEYFLFLPDDFAWIFPFPLADAIRECIDRDIAELKLTCRGLEWFGTPGAAPQPWYQGNQVQSGERLKTEGRLLVSRRYLFRDFHEQFSLSCNLLQAEFFRWVVNRIPIKVRSPGEAEKWAYLRLLLRRYAVAYYRMWIPAFHFIDINVEGDNPKNRYKVQTMLVEENYGIYNQEFNGKVDDQGRHL